MKFSEFVARNENAWLQDIIPLLQQIYVNAHNWNIDDSVPKVVEGKKRYVIDKLLIYNIDNKIVRGELVYDYAYDNIGEVFIDSQTLHPITELKFDRSYVNIKSLICHVVKEIKDISLIPKELLVVAGIFEPGLTTVTEIITAENDEVDLDVPINNVSTVNASSKEMASEPEGNAPAKVKNEQMQKLAIEAHSPLNTAKENIRDYVRKESNRVEGDKKCTCMHSQFFRYMLTEIKKGNQKINLEYKTGKRISPNGLKKLVIEAFDESRLQDRNMVLQKCDIHGLNT